MSRFTHAPNITAARLAAALEVSPQAIRKALRGVRPSARVRVHGGQMADAYALAALPLALAQRLDAKAKQQGFRCAEAMLATGSTLWHPPIPRAQIREEDWSHAQKLQHALLPSLRRLHHDLSGEDFESAGVADYRREFGREISARYLRELLATVRQRDGGAENWSRTEIFLPATLIAREAGPALADAPANLAALTEFVGLCGNPAQLTETEWRGLWATACEEIQRLTQEGWTADQAARAVRDALAVLPPLTRTTRDALRIQLARKLRTWKANGERTDALRDKREDNGRPVVLPQSDFDRVIACAGRMFRGQVAPAVRHLIETRQLSAPALLRYGHVLQSRGYTPEIFAEQCGYKAHLYYMHGLDKLDEFTGSIERDWNALPSLQVFSADDLTACVVFYVENEDGTHKLIRGQVLVFEDYSTGMMLGYSLQPEGQYNARVIRSLFTHVCSKYGVPTGLYFENNIWRRSVLMKGSRADALNLTQAEVTRGLEDFGIRFIHTKHPWSKPIEKSFDLLQTRMQAVPGYCGREEKYDLPPAIKRARELVGRKLNPAHPKDFGLLTLEEWYAKLGELCDDFNRTPQKGARCGGLSPMQACEARLPRNANGQPIPNMTFTPEVRHKLALHHEFKTVRANGVEFCSGKFRYRGEELAPFLGRRVKCGFDSENPELLTVENPDTGLVFAVRLHEKVNPLETIFAPDSGALAREHTRANGQIAPLRAYFKALDCSFEIPRSVVVTDALTVENGKRIEAAREGLRAENRLSQRARRFTEKTGLPVAPARLADTTSADDAAFAEWMKGNP